MSTPTTQTVTAMSWTSLLDESAFRALKIAEEEGWVTTEQVKGIVNQLFTQITGALSAVNDNQQNPGQGSYR